MSEYMTSGSVASLIGAPAGYIGYEDDGSLTKEIKRNPYSIVLFDEIEKAHFTVHNVLLQIMEEGVLTNNKGTSFSFKNAIIVMTYNVGFKDSFPKSRSLGFEDANKTSGVPECMYTKEDIMNELRYTFRPEFLNRIDSIIPYNYLNRPALKIIVNETINHEISKISAKINLKVVVSNETREIVVDMVVDANAGARPTRSVVNKVIVDPICERYLESDCDMTTESIVM